MRQSLSEDEFDLLSSWAAIVRWKYLVGGLSLLGLVAGLGLALIRPMYESRAILQIGRIGGVGRIQTTAELVQHFSQSDSTGHFSSAQEIADGLLLVTARGRDQEEARAFLAAHLDEIVRSHAEVFAEASLPKTRARQRLVERISKFETQTHVLAGRAEAVAPRNPALAAVLTQDQMRLAVELAALEQRLHALDMELSGIATSPTRVVREPTVGEAAAGKRRRFFPLTGAAAGLVLGVVASLLLGARPRREVELR